MVQQLAMHHIAVLSLRMGPLMHVMRYQLCASGSTAVNVISGHPGMNMYIPKFPGTKKKKSWNKFLSLASKNLLFCICPK